MDHFGNVNEMVWSQRGAKLMNGALLLLVFYVGGVVACAWLGWANHYLDDREGRLEDPPQDEWQLNSLVCLLWPLAMVLTIFAAATEDRE